MDEKRSVSRPSTIFRTYGVNKVAKAQGRERGRRAGRDRGQRSEVGGLKSEIRGRGQMSERGWIGWLRWMIRFAKDGWMIA